MAGKTIEITNSPEDGTTSVMVEQRALDNPELTGVEISPSGGISLETGLGWGVDVAVVLVAVAGLYVGKKFVDKWFSKES
jgi:uncharacterized protein YcfJ